MKRLYIIFITIVTFCVPLAAQQPQIITPTRQHDAAFAIFVDRATYDATTTQITAYRDALERFDNLSTYIYIGEWDTPEPIRTQLRELVRTNNRLEGAVFIGDIPIAFVRDAQHLTSSFKMDQDRFAWHRSSVPSDRVYDDFDLKFDYLRPDENNPLHHYYSLRHDSPQFVQSDIYTGRIKAPVTGEQAHRMIAAYLEKVVAYKAAPVYLTQALFFTGHGYHSESLASWEGEAVSLREQHPRLYRPGGNLTNIYHYKENDLKQLLGRQLQRPDLNMAVFHAHGTPEIQLLTGSSRARTLPAQIETIQYTLRSRYRTAVRRNQSTDALIANMREQYGIDASWFDGVNDPEVITRDSLRYVNDDFYTTDIDRMTIGAQLVVFDQCFNGAFHESPNISASYLFGPGNTIAALGHTVSILQDSDANAFNGLIDLGLRAGYLHFFKNHLETHILGDPTFRFRSDAQIDINRMLHPTRRGNAGQWERLWTHADPNIRVTALHMSTRLRGADMGQTLRDVYFADNAYIVRLQVMKELASMRNARLPEVLMTARHDPYEFIRRIAIGLMGDLGDEQYIPYLAEALVRDHSRRVQFKARYAIQKVNAAQAADACMAITRANDSVETSRTITFTIQNLIRTGNQIQDEYIPLLTDREAAFNERRNTIRTFRLYRYQEVVPYLVQLVQDPEESDDIRILAAETLGWFKMSYTQKDIHDALAAVLPSLHADSPVYVEVARTVRRLADRPNHPFTL
jgi:hypothetical protein